jgi:plasmid replication initiation protein
LYGHFNEKVLNVAESELKEKCDIFFTYIPLKNGKKVEKIKFTIHKNIKNAKISETDVNELQKPIYDRILSDLKVAEAILQGIFQKYPLEKIETAYLETLERSKVSKVENTAGYFISLVKDPEY